MISIIDMGNEYYLVAFSREEDKSASSSDDPWFIYDHYLTVKVWTPNFQSKRDTIDEVTVWIRIASIPMEYYDSMWKNVNH